MAFVPSFVQVLCQLEIVAHPHDGIHGFCTELLQVGNFLPTHLSWQLCQLGATNVAESAMNVAESATNMAERYVEFVPNLADTPRTWQKKPGTWQSHHVEDFDVKIFFIHIIIIHTSQKISIR